MTNNNWEQEFENKLKPLTKEIETEIIFLVEEAKYDQDGSRIANVLEKFEEIMYRQESYFQSLLTKKDQEHKAELEMIREVFWETYDKNSDYYSESTEKGEMDNSNEAAYTTSVLNQIIKGLRDKGIELEETTAILDTHINKLSTE